MSLSSGNRLGPYEILGTLGAGGMGEVYKARDVRLQRLVAIKVLLDPVAADPDLRQRFEREARAVATLQHAHICTLHDVGHQNGTDYLVMEYLEGQTLAERLQRGALPIDRVIRYAIEIADALDQAHRAGIIHRDLKPGNIMLTASGVKLLDFGLAKLRAQGALAGLGDAATRTSPVTDEGRILGTLAYMAPEQIEGLPLDHRVDIWAFGCIVYEMASGRRTFEGKSQAGTIAAILEREPEPLSKRQPVTPPSLNRLVSRCLAKDPDDRWQSARDLFLELRALSPSEAQPARPAARQRRHLIFDALAVILIAVLGLALWMMSRNRGESVAGPTLRLSIAPDPAASFPETPAIAPDGTRIAFVATSNDGIKRLWLWGADTGRGDVVPASDGASLPFWAPDSRRVAFFASGKLKRMDVGGGPPQAIADAPSGMGGSWNADGTIIFAPDTSGGLSRVAAMGGTVTALTTIDRTAKVVTHRRPSFLPDGDHFIYLAQEPGEASSRAFVASLQAPANATPLLMADSDVVFSSGSLVYARGPRLFAQAFDVRSLKTAGTPVVIAENLPFSADRGVYSSFTVSPAGILCYTTGGGRGGRRQFIWVNHTGQLVRKVGPAEQFRDFDVSRDRRRAVVARWDHDRGLNDLWLMDLERGALSRFTTEPVSHTDPLWSPDGRRVAFSVRERLFFDIHQRGTEANARDEVLLTSDVAKYVEAWSPDGRNMLFGMRKGGALDLWTLPLGTRQPRVFLENAFMKDEPEFSPDGKWVAYNSNETGRWEVYVTSFPNADEKFQVSTDGGVQAHWRADQRVIYYLSLDGTLMSVNVDTGRHGLTAGVPRALFATGLKTNPGSGQYAVSRDGQQFLLLTDVETERSPAFSILLNWRNLLRQ